MIQISKNILFHTKLYVDQYFKKPIYGKDYETVASSYLDALLSMKDDDFETLLTITGYIPDLYASDSSEETLFSKLVEVIVCAWAIRCGFEAKFVKQKASYEDVDIYIGKKIVVCDSKSFRLGRSQAAPNVKDFLKLEDMRKWLSRFEPKARLGGLVAFPSRHEWRDSSDAYLYCSTKEIPVLMLPYEYLAFLYRSRSKFTYKEIWKLWDYKSMFPTKLSKDTPGGNKAKYWEIVKKQVCEVTKTSEKALDKYLENRNALIKCFIQSNISLLSKEIENINKRIEKNINSLDNEAIRELLISYQKTVETSNIQEQIKRIKDFREY